MESAVAGSDSHNNSSNDSHTAASSASPGPATILAANQAAAAAAKTDTATQELGHHYLTVQLNDGRSRFRTRWAQSGPLGKLRLGSLRPQQHEFWQYQLDGQRQDGQWRSNAHGKEPKSRQVSKGKSPHVDKVTSGSGD